MDDLVLPVPVNVTYGERKEVSRRVRHKDWKSVLDFQRIIDGDQGE
jgi:hypothetical protein